jgi:cell division protein FtsB
MPSFLTPSVIKFILFLVVFLAGMGVGVKLMQPKIDKLNQEIGEYKSAYASLAATTAEQNAAIEKLRIQAKARAEAAKKAVEAAQADATNANKHAAEILAKKPPPGVDPCTAASAELDAELKTERNAK